MKPQFDIPCIILCGGKSSRMKEDKSLLPFANETSLAKYQYNRLKPYFKEIYLSCKNNKFDFEANLLLEDSSIYSPIVGLSNIINKTNSYDKFFLITVDTPLIKIESIKELINQSENYDITVAQTKRVHNLCGVFSKDIKKVVNSMLLEDMHKISFLLDSVKTKIVKFNNEDEFINFNHPEDYKKALSIIS